MMFEIHYLMMTARVYSGAAHLVKLTLLDILSLNHSISLCCDSSNVIIKG